MKKTNVIVIVIVMLVLIGIFSNSSKLFSQAVVSMRDTELKCSEAIVDKMVKNGGKYDICTDNCKIIDDELVNCISNKAKEEGVESESRANKYGPEDYGEFAYVCYDNDEWDDTNDPPRTEALHIVVECIEDDVIEQPTTCPSDVLECDDGTILLRSFDNDCNFPECPIVEDPIVEDPVIEEQEEYNYGIIIGVTLLLLIVGFVLYVKFKKR